MTDISQTSRPLVIGSAHGSLEGHLPWKTALLAFGVTVFVCLKLSVLGPSPGQGSIPLTLCLIVCAAFGVSTFPGTMLRILLCLYLLLEVLGVGGLIGYSTVSYVTLIIAILLARIVTRSYDSSPRALPGTRLQLCLSAVMFLQFFRSASMGGAFPVLCDDLAFATVLWHFPRIPPKYIHSGVRAFIIGTGATVLAFLFTFSLSEYRLGDFFFNPNELGNVVGAAFLFLISGFFIETRRLTFWCFAFLLGAALLLTGSRTSIYACFASIVLFLLFRRRRLLAASLTLAAAVLLLVAYVNQFGADLPLAAGRLASPVSQSFDESSAQRARIWGFLLSQVSDYWKWGVGLRNVPLITDAAGIDVLDAASSLSVGYQSHNLYLTALLELGILGLALLVVWQIKVISWGFRKSFDHALIVPLMFYLIVQGFFQGLNLNFLSALLLVAAYKSSPNQ